MEKAKLTTVAMLCLLLAGVLLNAQNGVITLRNPSFEDIPRHSMTPREWIDCGFPGESEPDVQPSGEFGVTKLPVDGDTYLGMVTRDNDTWERVSQRLSNHMARGNCYGFSIYLMKSPQYLSLSRLTGENVNYIRHTKLRIYGGYSPCHRGQLLAESPMISNYDWKQYSFRFQPEEDYSFITFEVYYETPKSFPYNGNLLLDHASAITTFNCEDPLPQGVYTAASGTPVDSISEKAVQVNSTPSAPKFNKGELIPLKEIKFITGRSELTGTAMVRLEKLTELLILNPTLVVEINVHLNHHYDKVEAEDLTVKRAVAIEQFLEGQGVNKQRFKVYGRGNSRPVNPKRLSDDDERVEVKVVEF